MAKQRKVSLRTQIRRLSKKADAALSTYIREQTRLVYGECPFCHRTVVPHKPTKNDPRLEVSALQCCFHFIRRKRKILRWDIRNVIAACNYDNYREYRLPDEYRAWFLRTYGVELYLELADKSKEDFEPTVEFLQGVIDKYTEELKLLLGNQFHGKSQQETTSSLDRPGPRGKETPST